MTEWSTPASVRTRLRKRWSTGAALTAHARGEAFVPLDLPLRGPTASQVGARYADVAAWVRDWAHRPAGCTLTTKVIGARRTGGSEIPDRLRIESFDGLTAFLGTADQARRHRELVEDAAAVAPQIRAWVVDRPMRALDHHGVFDRLLACVRWLLANADRDRYFRQIDVPGVDTKFIERHRAVLAELLDSVIAPVDQQTRDFAERYGFRSKPPRVRIRILDPRSSPLPAGITDVELPVDELRGHRFDVERVFVVENEVTCLAFPTVPRSLLIFGGGYAVSRVSRLDWLRDVALYYWGDIDTHGFRILDLMRKGFRHTRSVLMDRTTLLAHEDHWDREPAPVNADLTNLTDNEAALYRDLVEDVFGTAVRLEQERISYSVVEAAVNDMR